MLVTIPTSTVNHDHIATSFAWAAREGFAGKNGTIPSTTPPNATNRYLSKAQTICASSLRVPKQGNEQPISRSSGDPVLRLATYQNSMSGLSSCLPLGASSMSPDGGGCLGGGAVAAEVSPLPGVAGDAPPNCGAPGAACGAAFRGVK